MFRRISPWSRRRGWTALVLATVALAAVSNGCSKESKTLRSIRGSYAKGQYEETITLCEHALRSDVREPEVHYYYGLSLLAKGRDFEAIRRFDEAVLADSALVSPVAQRLAEVGKESLVAGEKRRGAERLAAALRFDPGIDLGSLEFAVADVFFGEKNFAEAARLYRSGLEADPDTSSAESAYFNLADCYLSLSDSTAAVAALEAQLERFPRGPLASRAQWKLAILIYENARAEFERGNHEDAVEQVSGLLEWATDRTLVQRARFLLGEAYERLEDYPKAYEQYKAIIQEDRGASGRIVDRARAKINAFRDSGLL